MDVIDLLIADHNRVRGLFARYSGAEDTDDKTKASLLASVIIEELNVHMAAEEKVFYRSVKERSEEISANVDEGFEEHHVAEMLINEISGLKPGSDPWVAKMTVLIESVEHHIKEEEEELFPSVRSNTDIAWRANLGDKFEADKVRLGATALAEKLDLSASDLKEKARSTMNHDELAATVDSEQS